MPANTLLPRAIAGSILLGAALFAAVDATVFADTVSTQASPAIGNSESGSRIQDGSPAARTFGATALDRVRMTSIKSAAGIWDLRLKLR